MADKFGTENDQDLFGSESAPSLSFKKVPEGHSYTGKVASLPVIMQQRNFDSGELEVWKDGNPKQVVTFKVDIDGEVFSVWAKKPSSLFKAIQEAQKEAGGRLAVGDDITITWVSSSPNLKNPKLNDIKNYEAKLVKADALAD